MKPVLISGVPCCGKTSFGDYLRDHHGFLHVDLEAKPSRRTVLHRLWDESYQEGRIRRFFNELEVIHPRSVVTWGFPVALLPVVTQIASEGIGCWWFDGDVVKAEAEWVVREKRQPQGSERNQFDALSVVKNIENIRTFYGGCVIPTLASSGYLLSYEEIYSQMFERSVR